MDEFMKTWHFHFCILQVIVKSSSIYQLHALNLSPNSLSQDKSISMHNFSNFQKSGILVDDIGTTGGLPVQPVLREICFPTTPRVVPTSCLFRATGSTGDTPVQPVGWIPCEVGPRGRKKVSSFSFLPHALLPHTPAVAPYSDGPSAGAPVSGPEGQIFSEDPPPLDLLSGMDPGSPSTPLPMGSCE